jgi:hypothetical protein
MVQIKKHTVKRFFFTLDEQDKQLLINETCIWPDFLPGVEHLRSRMVGWDKQFILKVIVKFWN